MYFCSWTVFDILSLFSFFNISKYPFFCCKREIISIKKIIQAHSVYCKFIYILHILSMFHVSFVKSRKLWMLSWSKVKTYFFFTIMSVALYHQDRRNNYILVSRIFIPALYLSVEDDIWLICWLIDCIGIARKKIRDRTEKKTISD